MLLISLPSKKPSPWLLFPITLLLTLYLSCSWVSATQPPKPKPQQWQINGILAALDDEYDEVKKYAFEKLNEYDPKDLKSALPKSEEVAQKAAKLLKDKNVDPNVRIGAAEALGNLGNAAKPYIPDIANILKDENVNFFVHSHAAEALGNLGDAAQPYVPEIANILKDKSVNSYVRSRAAEALGNLGDAAKPYIPDIANILKDQNIDPNARIGAAEALGNLGDAAKPYVPEIANILKDKSVNSYVRSRAAEALGKLGEAAQPYVPDILNFLKDEKVDFSVRSRVAEALGKLGDTAKPYIPDILNFLKDENVDSSVRSRVAEALGNLGEAAQPYVPDILNFLKDESVDYSVRGSAAEALGKLGDAAQPYIPDILNFLKDESVKSYVRGSAAVALGNLGDAAQPYVPELANILKDKSVNSYVRSRAAVALGNLGEAAQPYVPDILNFLKDKSVKSYVRIGAAVALGNLGEAAQPYVPEIANILKDKSVDYYVRGDAVEALGKLGEAAQPYIPDILNILKDENVDSNARSSAAEALGNLGEAAKPYIPDIVNILKDKNVNSYVRWGAAVALGNIGQLNLDNVVVISDSIYYEGQSEFKKWRFLTYFLGGGTEEVKTLLKWLGKPKTTPNQIKYDEGKKTLDVFLQVWKPSEDLPKLRKDLASKIATVFRQVSWQPQDIILLENHYKNLKQAGYNEADSILSVIINLQGLQYFFNARNTIITHLAFWLALIFAYPKFPQVQAIFFWNPWVRRILGMGYVGFLLTWFPFFRRKLFEPFKPSLLADAALDRFDEKAYFPTSKLKIPGTEDTVPITTALPSIKGQIIIEGDSGLGKTMFIRHLLKNSRQIIVYLPAQKCENGVIEAIQAKLHGQAQDENFLKNLIYSGALDICIDGLNEVTADTRAKITQFVESYFRGNIIMTTQPLEWTPPSTAKIYKLQPLEQNQIQDFLLSRAPRLPQNAKVQGKDYQKACTEYLNQTLHHPHSLEELAASQRILSNPMDLSLVSLMISQNEYPDLFHLQQQQYNLMSGEYLAEWKQEFPLKKFSEAVYQMRLNDEQALPADNFPQVVMSLEDEKYKMVISRQWKDEKGEAKKEWYFRHDKIMDFFLVQNFLGDSDDAKNRLIDHISDPRFRGVYFLLATLLPLDAAKELREKLIQYAADTKDHTVSDTFVQLLRSRT